MPPLRVRIDDVAFGGHGVGRINGKAVFVPFTVDGEEVAATVVREKRHFSEAKLDQIHVASIHRVPAKCRYFGRCGGCSYQHITYAHQLAIKSKQVEQTLRRIARLNAVPMQPTIPSPAPYAYRNRITVHAANGVLGYYRRGVHQLIDVEQCPIAAPEVNVALAELRARKPRNGHYTLRRPGSARIFAQTNEAVADALARHVRALLSPGGRLLIDAYCGAGFFGRSVADQFERVVGIEWDRYAVAVAQEHAASNESYVAGDVSLELARELAAAEPATTCVIVDPPAAGLSAEARRTLVDRPVHTLVYVSCNPATLARDLAELQERFIICSVTPFDMFPQTAEIECAVHLEPRRPGLQNCRSH